MPSANTTAGHPKLLDNAGPIESLATGATAFVVRADAAGREAARRVRDAVSG